MEKIKAGFINFMPFGVKGEEYYSYLEYYGKLGFKGFENGTALLDGDVKENLKRVRSYGITPIDISYMSFPGRPPVTMEELVENAHKLEVTRVVAFDNLASAYRFGGRPDPAPYDEIMKEIEDFETKAAFFKKEGISLMYHNHDVELRQCYKGVPQLQLIAANTEALTFELDCGWADFAGADPVKLIHQLKKRIAALHIKDYQPNIVNYPRFDNVKVPQFTTVGTGELDLKGCLQAGIEENIEWAIVEQDFYNHLDQKESLTAACYNMKETGLIE